MDEFTFCELLDRYGSDLIDWPDDLIDEASSLLTKSASARALLATAHALEQQLRALPQRGPRAGLAVEIVNRVADRDRWDELGDWFRAALWRPVMAATAPLLFGFLVGLEAVPEEDAALMAELSELSLTAVIEEPDYDQ